MTSRWDPSIDLEALLVALEGEILSCSDEELHAALAASGRAHETARYEMRAVLDTALRDDDAGALPPITEDGTACERLWRH